jgi:hypothetical protein
MSTADDDREQQRKKISDILEKKDWMDYAQDFIKNPATTGITGLIAGYFLGTYKASKDIEVIKDEHKKQMTERDDQFKLLVREIKQTHKLIASQKYKELPMSGHEDEPDEDEENTLQLEQDPKTKWYRYKIKKKKKFEIKA